MRVTFTLGDKTYTRNYEVRFCELCGNRIPFRMSAKGIPEDPIKYNKRVACCDEHARELRRRKLKELQKTKSKGVVKPVLNGVVSSFLYGSNKINKV